MWIYVIMDFPIHRKSGRTDKRTFCNKLEKDGFVKMHKNLYVRHSTTLTNAIKHKNRVMEWVVQRSQISILLIGDKQSEYAFHQLGYRKRKKAEELLQTPSEIEFF